MLKHVSARKIPTTVCTLYNPNFGGPEQTKMCEPALSALNNAIISEAIKVYSRLYNNIDEFFFV
jgi:hypothetical protein